MLVPHQVAALPTLVFLKVSDGKPQKVAQLMGANLETIQKVVKDHIRGSASEGSESKK